MRAGLLDRLITIQQNSPSKNSHGENIAGWSALYTNIRAQVIQKSAREYFSSADHDVTEAVTVFKIRYRSDVTTGMRVVYDSENYEIHAITEIGRNEGLELIARAIGV